MMTFTEIEMSLEIGLIYGIVAMGIYLTLRILDFPDLTCDGSFTLGSLTAASLIQAQVAPWCALILAACASGIAGATTAILNTVFKISSLLSGILVAFVLYSVNLKVTGSVPNIALFQEESIFTGLSPLIALISISFFSVVALSFLFSTDFGLSIRATGQNKKLAMHCGVNINAITILTLAISNALIGVGGALLSQHMGFADISQGLGTIVIGIAAVIIGEKLIPCRSIILSLVACLVGSILYRLFIALALHSDTLGLKTEDLNLITGLMIVIVLFVPMPQWKSLLSLRSSC